MLLITSKSKNLSSFHSFGFRPYTVKEKNTNDDDELVVGQLENKSTAHNFNETSRSGSNVETSELDFMKRGEQDNRPNKCTANISS